ncbi:putative ATP-dependent RNA helicase dhr2 [Actinomortierella ambigua]|uniref:RNA helicase n=1 Tax=Actinomortierella ambigua TaxID=1343610 RepID=A0A9P6PX76_9FUNG|nr:putative ATP-dependent RNA helicase dhr2 [Actinomortierella ambigua]
MFNAARNAKRKIITFGDDGETIPSLIVEDAKASSLTELRPDAALNEAVTGNAPEPPSGQEKSINLSCTAVSNGDSNNKRQHIPKRKFESQKPYSSSDRRSGNAAKQPEHVTEALRQKARELAKHRKQLPIFSARETIIKEVKDNACVIIVGETGSGKTTQIPQYFMEAGLSAHGTIAVTQPRRVAAINLAKRVAQEVGTTIGNQVGYSIRFDDTSSKGTKIKYMTDGIMLRELLSDRLLLNYSVIVLDEAHERTLRTDILFGMVKSIQKQRAEMIEQGKKGIEPLKIVVMSATLDAEKFSAYFYNAKIMYISGRMYPVKVLNTIEPQSDYVDAALVTAFQIHQEETAGDILIFLTGQEEIENLEKLIEEYSVDLPTRFGKLIPCPIFAAQDSATQQKIFEPTPAGCRKVILATNIAETSITIPNIRYVVDTGCHKSRGYNAKIGIESLLIEPISKSSARQRMGRAGREAPGLCFRLYTEDSFEQLEEDTVPEIKRCNLASAILALKASGVEDVTKFDYMDRPSKSGLLKSMEQLYALGALDDKGDLTEMGKKMAGFPVDPPYAKVLLQSEVMECTKEAIEIIALLSVDTIFTFPSNKREEANEARQKFLSLDGDHLSLLNVLRGYESVKGDRDWCRENFINGRHMRHVLEVRKQLIEFSERAGINPRTSCGHDYEIVLKCFLAGFFQNAALLQPDSTYKAVVGGLTVNIHPSSAMFGKKRAAIMYNELVFTTKHYIRGVSAIEASWLAQAAPKYFGQRQA